MKTFIIAGLVLFMLVVLSVVAQQVGGVRVQSTGVQRDAFKLSMSEPVIRGIPTVVHLQSTTTNVIPAVSFEWRTEHHSIPLPAKLRGAQTVFITLPCDSDEQGSIIARSRFDDAVLDQKFVTVFPPGVDCALGR